MANSNSRSFLYIFLFLVSSICLTIRLLSDYDTSSSSASHPKQNLPVISKLLYNNTHSTFNLSINRTNLLQDTINKFVPITKVNSNDAANEANTVDSVTQSKDGVKDSAIATLNEKQMKPAASDLDFDTSFLRCHNQSECIPPRLFLVPHFKVYMCKHTTRGGVRFYYLVRDGLLQHPKIIMVDTLDLSKIDFIIYLPNSSPWHKSECADPMYADKLIVLDEFDGHQLFAPYKDRAEREQHYPKSPTGKHLLWNFMFFKRSYVRRIDGVFRNYPHIAKEDVYPMTYSIAEAYTHGTFNQRRDTEIACTLRGSNKQQTRLRVQQWVAEYIQEKGMNKSVHGQLDGASRQTVSRKYFDFMMHSQIVVTVNPSFWEGDFRLWEALSTGALVFVDHIMVPHPFPLIDKKHVIYFSSHNKEDLTKKLDYYLAHKEEARVIALRGYLHAMQYHRTSNFIDYVMRTAHTKLGMLNDSLVVPKYPFTGQYLVAKAASQIDGIKKSGLPGVY